MEHLKSCTPLIHALSHTRRHKTTRTHAHTHSNKQANTDARTNYHSITEELIFALKFQAKAVNSINDEDVRLSKRLYLSSRNLRGFESGRVGPKDGTDFIGGNYLSSLNIFC